jgi:hypothetical protein
MALEIIFGSPLVVIHGTAPPAGYRAIVTIETPSLTVTGEFMSATMQVHSYATLSVQWKDIAGNIVKVDGPTNWESSNEDILEVEVATGNPQIANLYAPGEVGTAEVHATADADLGEGVKTVTATITVQVISGQAVSGDIQFSQSPSQGPQASGTHHAAGGKASDKPADKPADKAPAKK